jgi:hypothetical protein
MWRASLPPERIRPSKLRWSAAATLLVTTAASANPVDDFRRGASLELSVVTADLHVDFGGRNEFRPAMASGSLGIAKPPGSLDINFDLTALGFPIEVPLHGESLNDREVVFTANQALDNCIEGLGVRITHVSGRVVASLALLD